MTCPECGGHHGNGQLMFRSARLGAPFLLMQVIPTLLEFCPDGDDPNAKPMRGRRMITFTDSRQGTARIAASLQQDAERNRLRALVSSPAGASAWGRASTTCPAGRTPRSRSNCSTDLDNPVMLRRSPTSGANSRLGAPPVVTFVDMAAYLAQHEADVNRWALRVYRDLDPGQFGGDPGALELARSSFWRESSHGVRSESNSLETMGLVSIQYPKLDRVSAVPTHLSPIAALSVDEWRQLLKTSLDFVVREEHVHRLHELVEALDRRALFPEAPASAGIDGTADLLPSGAGPSAMRLAHRSRLVRLLAVVLRRDPTTPDGRDVIDSVLASLWDDLVRVELLQKSSEGRYLSFDDIAFSRIADGWLCPVTRRVLDVTLRGITPYLPGHNRKASTIECRKLHGANVAWVDYGLSDRRRSIAGRAQVAGRRSTGSGFTRAREYGRTSTTGLSKA